MRMDARPWTALLLWIVFAGVVAKADPIGEPIQLNPFLPGAFIAVAETSSPHSDLGDEETVNQSGSGGLPTQHWRSVRRLYERSAGVSSDRRS
jgi:hypothetical protein